MADETQGVPTVAEAIAALPAAVAAVRSARRLSLRAAADEMGIGFSNLHRLEKGGNCTLATVTAAARWLEGPANSGANPSAQSANREGDRG